MSARDDYTNLAAYAQGVTRSYTLATAEAGAALDEIDRLRVMTFDREAVRAAIEGVVRDWDCVSLGVIDRITNAVLVALSGDSEPPKDCVISCNLGVIGCATCNRSSMMDLHCFRYGITHAVEQHLPLSGDSDPAR